MNLAFLIFQETSVANFNTYYPLEYTEDLMSSGGIDQTTILLRNSVSVIETTEERNLWIGTMEELLYFDSDSGEFTSLSEKVRPTSILESNNDWTWIGTDDHGLLRLENASVSSTRASETKEQIFITPFESTKELLSNSIASILEDDAGNLWIGTENGLSRLDIEDESVRELHNERWAAVVIFFLKKVRQEHQQGK